MKKRTRKNYDVGRRPWEDLPWWISWHIVQELIKERRI